MRFTNPPQLSPKAPYWGSHSAPASRGSQRSRAPEMAESTKDLRRIYEGSTKPMFMGLQWTHSWLLMG